MHRNPVLLIHGILVQARVFRRMANYLTRSGWDVHALNLTPHLGEVGIDELAVQIADYIDKNFTTKQTIDIVGFSMGGIVSRYYIQRLEGIKKVQRFISISAPHYGTKMAYLLNSPGCLQMRPDSPFLADLNRDVAMLAKLNFTSIWTPWDFVIVPANSSKMPVGKEVKLSVVIHGLMTRHPATIKAVAEALREPFKPYHLPD